jgi:putative colanic acid biosynthesis acetyltransferase WcaF
MNSQEHDQHSGDRHIPVIKLHDAAGAREAWDRPKIIVYLWSAFELVFVHNPWQISSALRVRVLRLFGAEIEQGVVFRPRTRVKFPWKLHIGRDCWIGEGVWFHNQDHVYVGHDVSISQESFLTTGSHAHRRDMALVTRPITIGAGAWITSRCVILGGANIGRSALITPGTVVGGLVPANEIWGGSPAHALGTRFQI